MSDALAGSLPFHGKISRAAETTPGNREPVRWVEVTGSLQPMEAIIIKGRLESLDIPAIVNQESIGSVMGLTVGPLGAATVSVPEPLAETALSVLAETFEPESDVEDGC